MSRMLVTLSSCFFFFSMLLRLVFLLLSVRLFLPPCTLPRYNYKDSYRKHMRTTICWTGRKKACFQLLALWVFRTMARTREHSRNESSVVSVYIPWKKNPNRKETRSFFFPFPVHPFSSAVLSSQDLFQGSALRYMENAKGIREFLLPPFILAI